MKIDSTHEAEVNFYYVHFNDCRKFVEWSKDEKSKLKSLYARHAILAAVYASEALINRVYNDFYLLKDSRDKIERTSTPDKWYTAPLLCGKEKPSLTTFISSEQPFQGYFELFKIRNWLVHPKCESFINARIDEDSAITLLKSNKDVPWVDTLESGVWPITRIPINPFEYTEIHAQKSLTILENMVNKLKLLMSETVTEEWITQIKFRCKETKESITLTTNSLWGGYTPDIE